MNECPVADAVYDSLLELTEIHISRGTLYGEKQF